jgi:Lrp/AsnC family transcriptional regulator for asnA, asnC and gidA
METCFNTIVVELLPVELDEMDRKLLIMLQRDARTPFARIAREIGVSEATVRFRVKKLVEKGVITRFITLLDPRKIGLPITATIVAKVEPSLLDKAVEQLASFVEAHHVFQSTGEYDIVAVVHARDMAHLGEIRKRVKMIPGVKDVSVSVATRIMRVEPVFKL